MNIILAKDAQKQYEHLPQTHQQKIYKKLLSLQENPLQGKKLTGELKGIYSLRVWPYRVLYQVNKREKRVEVLKIAHRQGVY